MAGSNDRRSPGKITRRFPCRYLAKNARRQTASTGFMVLASTSPLICCIATDAPSCVGQNTHVCRQVISGALFHFFKEILMDDPDPHPLCPKKPDFPLIFSCLKHGLCT